MNDARPSPGLSASDLLELRRWNTPTIYNGWERITSQDIAADGFNREEVVDFMPEMGAMVGYALTVVIEPSNPQHGKANPNAWKDYRNYVASQSGPLIVVVQDLDKPQTIGAFWGEVNSGIHRALGCVGTIIDGAIRDIDDMKAVGFKALARRLCIGHAHSTPVRWGCPVEVFGRRVESGQLIHADKHGFLVVPRADEARLLEASRFLDSLECQTVIPAARAAAGQTRQQLLASIDAACGVYGERAAQRFQAGGEWSASTAPPSPDAAGSSSVGTKTTKSTKASR
jgi:4-hydroxy-4-methyl-2-oxoglutarate aldolase